MFSSKWKSEYTKNMRRKFLTYYLKGCFKMPSLFLQEFTCSFYLLKLLLHINLPFIYRNCGWKFCFSDMFYVTFGCLKICFAMTFIVIAPNMMIPISPNTLGRLSEMLKKYWNLTNTFHTRKLFSNLTWSEYFTWR